MPFRAKPVSRHKAPLGRFLAQNPFSNPLTLGFFYREKMRAIHAIAPDEPFAAILEVGGGRGGLTALLYPYARITNFDLDASFASAPCNRQERVEFLCGDATALPFSDGSFDAVTMFDLLEHVPDDALAAREAFRVLRPGGVLLVSSPNERWRFPYYSPLKPICPSEEAMFAEWGHVRRGYTVEELQRLTGVACQNSATFINPVTVIGHDFAFSKLPRPVRWAICAAIGPLTWLGYALHTPQSRGTETATMWRKTAAQRMSAPAATAESVALGTAVPARFAGPEEVQRA